MSFEARSRIPIRRESDIARAVVESKGSAKSLGFSDQEASKVGTSVSELARNIIKYAGSGEIVVTTVRDEQRIGIEISCRDRGPGIPDLESALRDHFSTGGTLGLGLPGVRRLMDDFEIESTPGSGTNVVVRLWSTAPVRPLEKGIMQGFLRGRPQDVDARGRGGAMVYEGPAGAQDVECGYFVRPCLGERVSGDVTFAVRRDDVIFVALIDALGHGDTAYRTGTSAKSYLQESWTTDVVATMNGLHKHLRGSIGVAAGLAVLQVPERRLRYVGVGNTSVRVFGAGNARLQSDGGTVGTALRTLRPQELLMTGSDVVLFYSDGVSDRFDLDDYPQLRYESMTTVAKTMVYRFGKSHDDASCLALKYVT